MYIDYAKAFDKIDHKILIRKLEFYGLSNEYLTWINDFLSNRQQFVFLNNTTSYKVPVISGVPQGSVLGPLLFILYINDLSINIESCKILTFADDTKLVKSIGSSVDTLLLQKDLDTIINWSAHNNMRLNKDKFELISHKYGNITDSILLQQLAFNASFFSYSTGDSEILPSTSVRDLGLIILF